jgi:Fe-S-cluster-containing hydrogenase component 2
VAVKCDLCFFDAEGPACVRACPHKALSLVSSDGNGEDVKRMKAVAKVREELVSPVFLQGGDE